MGKTLVETTALPPRGFTAEQLHTIRSCFARGGHTTEAAEIIGCNRNTLRSRLFQCGYEAVYQHNFRLRWIENDGRDVGTGALTPAIAQQVNDVLKEPVYIPAPDEEEAYKQRLWTIAEESRPLPPSGFTPDQVRLIRNAVNAFNVGGRGIAALTGIPQSHISRRLRDMGLMIEDKSITVLERLNPIE